MPTCGAGPGDASLLLFVVDAPVLPVNASGRMKVNVMSTSPQFFSDADVAQCLNAAALVDDLHAAWADLAQGQAVVMPRQRVDCGPVKLSTMGAVWPARGVAAVKSYTTVAGQFSFVVNLFDTRSNQPLAVLQAQELTRFRTAALTRLVARHAVSPRRSPAKLALFGAGLQGRSQAEVLLQEFPSLQRVAVVDPAADPNTLGPWARSLGVQVQLGDAALALQGADLVVTATRSKTPVFDGRLLEPGTLVVAMGTSLPTGTELDDTTLARAQRLLVEWRPQSLVEAGEVVQALKAGVVAEPDVIDLAQVYRGDHPWRRSADEIVVFKSVGVGLADLVAAQAVWLASRI